MLEFITLAGLSTETQWIVSEVLGSLTEAEDFYKDFLKQCVSDGLAQAVPEPFKESIAQSLEEFLTLFQGELKNCGLSGELTSHEFARLLKQLMNDQEVRQFLGTAFDTGIKQLDDSFLEKKWQELDTDSLPEDFDWSQLTNNYVRRVKGIIRSSTELSRQLELDQQERLLASTREMAGVPVSFDLLKYQESIKEMYGSLSLDSLDTTGAGYDSLRLWNIFVAQDVRECSEFAPQLYGLPKEQLAQLETDGGIERFLASGSRAEKRDIAMLLRAHRRSYEKRIVTPVQQILGLETPHRKRPRVVILGDPGSGKSTLLRYVSLNWAEQSQHAAKDMPVPIMIELRLYAQDKSDDKSIDFLQYLHIGNSICHLNQLELDNLFKSGNAVALFDGIDEVFDPRLRETVVNDIYRFSNDYPEVQIVVTSRWLGYKPETLRKAGFDHYMLQDFSEEQVEEFVRRWHDLTFNPIQNIEKERKRERLRQAISDSKAIKELSGNPLLLTMMAILNRNQKLPRDRARLYERASEVLLYQWDVEEKLYEHPDLKEWQIDVRDKQAMLRKVAYYMQTNKEETSGNVISRDSLEDILTEYLKTIDVRKARAVARIMIEQLRERNFILCYLGENSYAFVHRTFLEYFCASEFVYQFEKEREIDFKSLKELYKKHHRDESWDEVLRLIAGMIDHNFVGSIIDYLLEQPIEKVSSSEDSDSSFYYSDRVVRSRRGGLEHLFLATDCLAEVRTRNGIEAATQRLLVELQRAVSNEHPYSSDSSVRLLIVESIVRNWENDDAILSWLQKQAETNHCDIRCKAIRLIGRMGSGRAEILTWLQQQADIAKSKMYSAKGKNEKEDAISVRRTVVEAIALFWSSDFHMLEWFKALVREEKDSSLRQMIIGEVASAYKGDPKILPWLKQQAISDDDWVVRRTVTEIIITGWKRETTLLSWLEKIAENDTEVAVRRSAIDMVIESWKHHPDTLLWLKQRAREENWEVRRVIIEAIAKNWSTDPETLPWLKQQSQDHSDWDTHYAVINAIIKSFKVNSEILSWLKQRTSEEKDWRSLCMTMEVIAENWKNEPETLSWFKQRAMKGESWDVRRSALAMLAIFWRNDPKMLSWFQRQAETDSAWCIRSTALVLITQRWTVDKPLLDFLHYRATNDPFQREAEWQDNPRQIAMDAIIQHDSQDSRTKKLLEERAKDDNDESLRFYAQRKLSAFEIDNDSDV